MLILPVLDLMQGVVVRGVAGRRAEYRPLESRLTGSTEPLTVARALREATGLCDLYLADLDAILLRRPHLDLYRALAGDGFSLRIDAGLHEADQAQPILDAGAVLVAGLETLAGPETLEVLCRRYGGERIVFSLDLCDGRPLGDLSRWSATDPAGLVGEALAAGVAEVIVLDLAAVGTGRGPATLELCRTLRAANPELRLITGGGIRDEADLERLSHAGVRGALVASALHDGSLSATTVRRWSAR